MSLNCKQGDLAIVVRCWPYHECVGQIVTCVRPEEGVWGPGWFVEPRLSNGNTCIYDECLRPIRPHGDDERDEHDILVPHKEHA